jgi:hypothetical protein
MNIKLARNEFKCRIHSRYNLFRYTLKLLKNKILMSDSHGESIGWYIYK